MTPSIGRPRGVAGRRDGTAWHRICAVAVDLEVACAVQDVAACEARAQQPHAWRTFPHVSSLRPSGHDEPRLCPGQRPTLSDDRGISQAPQVIAVIAADTPRRIRAALRRADCRSRRSHCPLPGRRPRRASVARERDRGSEGGVRERVRRLDVRMLRPPCARPREDVGGAGAGRGRVGLVPLMPVALLDSPGAPTASVSPDERDRGAEARDRARVRRLDVRLLRPRGSRPAEDVGRARVPAASGRSGRR